MTNWYITEYEQIQLDTGFRIVFTTSRACHLWFFWTLEEPWVHRASGNKRGLTLKFAEYFCYVSWFKIEQDEVGDTLVHTFQCVPWPYCQTRWFVFAGRVGAEWSKSISPIFRKHNVQVWPPAGGCRIFRRRWTTTGSWLPITRQKFFAEVFFVPSLGFICTGGYFWTNTKTDTLVLVSIKAVDGDNKPVGLSLAHKVINLEDGADWYEGATKKHAFLLDVALTPSTNFALIIAPLSDAGNIWLRFRSASWFGPKNPGAQWNREGMRSLDGGVTWNPYLNETVFELWGSWGTP